MSNEQEDSERQTETVEDPESFVQTKRLKSIFKAKKKVREQRLVAKSQRYNRSIAYKSALENYLVELRPIFLRTESGRFLWKNKEFGPIKLSADKEGIDTSRHLNLSGLESLFELDDVISLEYEYVANEATGRMDREREDKQIPFSVLDSMLNEANEYLADQGIEIETSEDKPPAEI